MKTRMEKQISMSTITVLALVLMLVLGTVLVDHDVVWAKKPAPSLIGTIDYVFVGHLGIIDGEGRLLVWEGIISGDIEGEILYWFYLDGGPPNMPDTAHSSFYEARWEIWDGYDLLLAGDSAGQTATPPGKDDGIWRGNGIVTEAYGDFADWIGRQTYESGNVNWDFPYSGSGIFRIN